MVQSAVGTRTTPITHTPAANYAALSTWRLLCTTRSSVKCSTYSCWHAMSLLSSVQRQQFHRSRLSVHALSSALHRFHFMYFRFTNLSLTEYVFCAVSADRRSWTKYQYQMMSRTCTYCTQSTPTNKTKTSSFHELSSKTSKRVNHAHQMTTSSVWHIEPLPTAHSWT